MKTVRLSKGSRSHTTIAPYFCPWFVLYIIQQTSSYVKSQFLVFNYERVLYILQSILCRLIRLGCLQELIQILLNSNIPREIKVSNIIKKQNTLYVYVSSAWNKTLHSVPLYLVPPYATVPDAELDIIKLLMKYLGQYVLTLTPTFLMLSDEQTIFTFTISYVSELSSLRNQYARTRVRGVCYKGLGMELPYIPTFYRANTLFSVCTVQSCRNGTGNGYVSL